MKNKTILIFVIIVILLIAGFFLFNAILKKNITPVEQEEEAAIVFTPEIIVPDQAGGTSVFVDRAVLPDGGYIVIHREADGKPGAVIGASDFISAGARGIFSVDVNEELVEGDALFAMLHTDDGNEAFEFPDTDAPLADSDGNIVMARFTIVGAGALEDEVKL